MTDNASLTENTDTAPPDVLEMLKELVRRGASDLHLTADAPPLLRIDGQLVPLGNRKLGLENCRDLITGLLTETQRARLEEHWELDFALQVDNIGRFRGNAHYTRGAMEAALRFIPDTVPDILTIGHREIVARLCDLDSGLVLVTGATGSGKSTTLAAMARRISETRAGVVITIEDPVEFIIHNARGIVKQREIGTDTHSFAAAIRHGLRQDPDVIVVGEMRDTETIAAAITAAETGHLVLGSLHTVDAPRAISRMVDAFPAEQQAQIVAQLSNSLEAIVSQRLLPKESGPGRVLASEVLVANSAVRAVMRDQKWEQLPGLIEIGAREGMHTIDDSLETLYLNRLISKEEAMANARDKARIEALRREDGVKKRGLFG